MLLLFLHPLPPLKTAEERWPSQQWWQSMAFPWTGLPTLGNYRQLGKCAMKKKVVSFFARESISLNLLRFIYFANYYCHVSELEIEVWFKYHNENKTLFKCQYRESYSGTSAGLLAKMVQLQGESVAEYDYAKEKVISTFDHWLIIKCWKKRSRRVVAVVLGMRFYSWWETHCFAILAKHNASLFFSFLNQGMQYDSSQPGWVCLTWGKNKNTWDVGVVLFLFNLWWGGVVFT